MRLQLFMEGFSSIYEQAMNAHDLKILIEGLRTLEEPDLADEFECGLDALRMRQEQVSSMLPA
jgi:hypothetical protein